MMNVPRASDENRPRTGFFPDNRQDIPLARPYLTGALGPVAANEPARCSKSGRLPPAVRLLTRLARGGIFLALFSFPAMADDWTREDTAREAVYMTLHVIDWGQTRNIVNRQDEGYYETNRFMGKSPSLGRVNSYMAFSAIVHIGIAYALPSEWRKAFQYVSIGDKAAFVYHNNKIGLRVDF